MDLVPIKIFFGFSPCKYRIFGFGPWYFVLILIKSFYIEIGHYNIHFNPHFKGLKSNILHITKTKSNMNQFYKDKKSIFNWLGRFVGSWYVGLNYKHDKETIVKSIGISCLHFLILLRLVDTGNFLQQCNVVLSWEGICIYPHFLLGYFLYWTTSDISWKFRYGSKKID